MAVPLDGRGVSSRECNRDQTPGDWLVLGMSYFLLLWLRREPQTVVRTQRFAARGTWHSLFLRAPIFRLKSQLQPELWSQARQGLNPDFLIRNSMTWGMSPEFSGLPLSHLSGITVLTLEACSHVRILPTLWPALRKWCECWAWTSFGAVPCLSLRERE